VTTFELVKKQRTMSELRRHAAFLGNHDAARTNRTQVRESLAPRVQTKLTVGPPDDAYEREADNVADAVMRMADGTSQLGQIQRECDKCEEELNRAPAGPPNVPVVKPAVESGIQSLRGRGEPLPTSAREFFEPRLGRDLSMVRVHTGQAAADTARMVNARAFTIGRDLVFGGGQFAPATSSGKRLMAHELTHVIQQAGDPGFSNVQRQAIPIELHTSVDLAQLTDEELGARYDQIAQTLIQFNQSTADTSLLEDEAGRIGIEVARRTALGQRRTFTPESVERMRTYFVANATSAHPASCISTMNSGVRLLLNDPAQAVRGEVQTTMAQLQAAGRAGAARIIDFSDSAGRLTNGVRRPDVLRENVWDALFQLASGDVGWSVFGLSLMDGNHSVTLTLDNNNPSAPRVYWSDQWGTKGGWLEFNRTTLDAEITRLTQLWWDGEPDPLKKPKTRVTLWRLHQ